MSLLEIEELGVTRRGRIILSGISLRIGAGEVVGLIGPNGAGKTTLLRAALGHLPASGTSTLADMTPAARAKAVAYLPQGREIAWPVSVETLVTLGRTPHGGGGAAAVDRAIARMGLGALRHRPATELSGGEQARALIARVLAQEARLILADEPTAGLDPAAQMEAMEVFRAHATEGGAVVASLHDLGLAARWCTRLLLVGGGRLVADGPPDQVLVADNLARVFGITARFEQTPDGPVFQPLAVLR